MIFGWAPSLTKEELTHATNEVYNNIDTIFKTEVIKEFPL